MTYQKLELNQKENPFTYWGCKRISNQPNKSKNLQFYEVVFQK
ncbi:hypothetical protein T190820D02B_30267 [Tenacibaculum sp. 190524A05c]